MSATYQLPTIPRALIKRYNTVHTLILRQDHKVLQELIDSGQAWLLEGSVGREAMRALEIGACVLPDRAHKDYWGNTVPAYYMLEDGTKGTVSLSEHYYEEELA